MCVRIWERRILMKKNDDSLLLLQSYLVKVGKFKQPESAWNFNHARVVNAHSKMLFFTWHLRNHKLCAWLWDSFNHLLPSRPCFTIQLPRSYIKPISSKNRNKRAVTIEATQEFPVHPRRIINACFNFQVYASLVDIGDNFVKTLTSTI